MPWREFLKPVDFGQLVDPHDGRSDLEARVVEGPAQPVVHRQPDEDPPRHSLRGALRLSVRRAHRATRARLYRHGPRRRPLVGTSRDELVQLLEDSGAPSGLERLGELGVDRAIHPRLQGDAEAATLFERARALRAELQVEVPVWRLGVAVLARRMTSDEAFDWLDRLKVRRRDVDLIVGAIAVAPRIVERLREEHLDPAQVVALADPFAPDAPLLGLAREEQPALRDYFTRLRSVRLEIGGADLVSMGMPESPQIGEVLAELRSGS